MKHLLYLLMAVMMPVIMTSCGTPSADEIDSSLDTADAYLADGRIAEARKTADAICDADTARMSAAQLGHLAIIYMQVSDRSDDPSAVGQAIGCYRAALRADADSAAVYFESLPVGPDHYAIMLGEIVKQLDAPRNIPADEPLDLPADAAPDSTLLN